MSIGINKVSTKSGFTRIIKIEMTSNFFGLPTSIPQELIDDLPEDFYQELKRWVESRGISK